MIPRGLRIRPVEAVRAWLHAAGITEGLLFRAIWRGGRVKPQGLRGIDVARAVNRRRSVYRSGIDRRRQR